MQEPPRASPESHSNEIQRLEKRAASSTQESRLKELRSVKHSDKKHIFPLICDLTLYKSFTSKEQKTLRLRQYAC